MPVMVVEAVISFCEPATVVVRKITAALELSYVTLGKVTAAHMWSVPHAVRSISAHRVRSTIVVRSTAASRAGFATTTASHVPTATATKVCATAPATSGSATVGYQSDAA